MSDEDFRDALEEMTAEEMTEVFHYLGSTTEKEETIRNEKMKQQRKTEDGKSMLEFNNMPGEAEAEQKELASVPRGTILTGPPDRPILKFKGKGMKKAQQRQNLEKRRELKKQMRLKARQDFIDQHGAIDDEDEFNAEVISFDDYVENLEI